VEPKKMTEIELAVELVLDLDSRAD